MAGDWIKFEHVTPDKPEIVELAELMGMDRDAVVGKLVRIWIWADQNAINGYAKGITPAFVDELARAQNFASAMKKTGWIRFRKHGVFFPNFDRHNGNSAKQRALTAIRMRNRRYDASVTKASPEKRREEKRREEEQTKNPPTPLSAVEKIRDAGILPENRPRPGYIVERSDAPDWSKEDMAAIAHVKGQYAKWIEAIGDNKGRRVMPRSWNSKIVEAYRANGGDYIRAVTVDVFKAAYNGCQDKRYWGWGVVEQHLGKPAVRRQTMQADADFAALSWEEKQKWRRKLPDSASWGDSDLNRLDAKAAALWRKSQAATAAGTETRC